MDCGIELVGAREEEEEKANEQVNRAQQPPVSCSQTTVVDSQTLWQNSQGWNVLAEIAKTFDINS